MLCTSLLDGQADRFNGQLKSQLLAEGNTIVNGLELVSAALPCCTSDAATAHMFRFAVKVVTCESLEQLAFRQSIVQVLPKLCGGICKALSAHEHLAAAEGSVDAAEVIYRAADNFSAEFMSALHLGLQ